MKSRTTAVIGSRSFLKLCGRVGRRRSLSAHLTPIATTSEGLRFRSWRESPQHGEAFIGALGGQPAYVAAHANTVASVYSAHRLQFAIWKATAHSRSTRRHCRYLPGLVPNAQRNHMTPLLTLDELAQILGRSTHTIKSDIRRNPAAVPPRLQLPGTKLLRWRGADVEEWLSSHVVGRRPSRERAA